MQEKDATTKSFMNKLTAIYEVLCKLLNTTSPPPFAVTNTNCSGAPVTAQATSTVQSIPHPDFVQKVQLCNPNIDPEVVCLSNDGGTTIVKGWEVFDVSTNPPTSILYIGGAIATGYTVVPCNTPTVDREMEKICVDGQQWTKVYTFEGNLPVDILWLNQVDAPVAPPNPTLINNANCIVLEPTLIGMEQFSGLGNTTQNSTFSANEVTVTYDAPIFTSTPLTVTIIAIGLQGSGEFKVQPNTQETRKFKHSNITGATISGAQGSNVTVEFQLN